MPDVDPDRRAKLIAALEVCDAEQRDARAERMIWMSAHNQSPSMVIGNPESLGVLREATDAFREGHFISVILLGLAFVEHELVEDLVDRSLANFGVSLVDAIRLAREHQILETELLDRIDKLRLIRNPFAHRKAPAHPHSYGNRYIARRMHPKTLLEEDAKEAFQVMYSLFRAVLKTMPLPKSN